MAAPTATARGTPGGIPLRSGFRTKITWAANPTIMFWEKTVQPPGLEGGEKVNTTTMHNSVVRTFAPRNLYEMSDAQITVAYDPGVIDQIAAIINAEGTWTVTLPDGSTFYWYGALTKFMPDQLEEGKQPEAKITIISTGWDPVNHVEATYGLTSVAGT